MSDAQQDWREVADRLHDHGGVPERRAEIVALRAQGLTFRAIADELGLSDHSSVRKQVVAYQETRSEADWLAENGPDL